jgi:hypothetical protein
MFFFFFFSKFLETWHVLSLVYHQMKSTSAMATKNKQQRFSIEKSNSAFTRKVDTLEKNPEKSRG